MSFPEIDDDAFRRYAIRSRKNSDITLCWTESRRVADQLSKHHIVTRTSDGMRIFPEPPIRMPVIQRGLEELRVG